MRRLIAPLAALLLLLALATGVREAHAAALAPAPTDMPRPPATQTPYPTQTPAATYTPYPSPTVTHRPTLQLSSSQGMPGTKLIAVGSDFPDGGLITLYWDGAYLAKGTADDSGYVSITTKVPASGPGADLGPHEVHAIGPNRTSATALFTVAQTYHPALTTSVNHALPADNTVVSLDATGFAPAQSVTFSWDRVGGARIGGDTTDDSGAAHYDMTVDARTPVGPDAHRIYAAGATPTLSTSASFVVDAPPAACGGWGATVPWINWTFCIDPLGAVTSWLKDGADKAGNAVGAKVGATLVEQQDYSTVPELSKPLETTQMLAQLIFGVLFTVGITTWYYTRLGGAPVGEAVLQVIEGAVGFVLATSTPTFVEVYIKAVNWAGTQILADPGKDSGQIVGSLLALLVNPRVLLDFGSLAAIVALIGVFVVAALILLVLIMVTRTILTMFGAVLYLAAPLALVCAATSLTRGVAKAWAGLWFSTTLAGVAYALALVAVRAMLAMLGRTGAYENGLGMLVQGVAGIMVIYGAPRLCSYLVGRGGLSALGMGHAPLVSTAIGAAVGATTGAGAGALASALRGTGAGSGAGDGGGAMPGMPSVSEVFPTADVIEAPSYKLLGPGS